MSINKKNGQIVCAPQERKKCFKDVYHDLYKSKSTVGQTEIEDFLAGYNLFQLDNEATAKLEADITVDKVKAAVSQVSNNEAVRPGGLEPTLTKLTGPAHPPDLQSLQII